LLLEGGPTLGAAFLTAGLVDKILLFVAPKLSGTGPAFAGPALELTHSSARRVGEDVLLSAYVREP
jgi:diaminohydroxyphosphoribosylaminopyrimidine deaminase/5-amino-6-(5-phosphoribosylamino)uracil reductase